MLPPQAETNGATITSEKIDLYIRLFSIRQGIGDAMPVAMATQLGGDPLCVLSALSAPIAAFPLSSFRAADTLGAYGAPASGIQ